MSSLRSALSARGLAPYSSSTPWSSSAGEGLGTAWGEHQARELLAHAGFTAIEVTQVEGDPFNNYYVASRS